MCAAEQTLVFLELAAPTGRRARNPYRLPISAFEGADLEEATSMSRAVSDLRRGVLDAFDRYCQRGAGRGASVRARGRARSHDHFDHYSWVGIYLVEEDELVLGPWQGPGADRARTASQWATASAARRQRAA